MWPAANPTVLNIYPSVLLYSVLKCEPIHHLCSQLIDNLPFTLKLNTHNTHTRYPVTFSTPASHSKAFALYTVYYKIICPHPQIKFLYFPAYFHGNVSFFSHFHHSCLQSFVKTALMFSHYPHFIHSLLSAHCWALLPYRSLSKCCFNLGHQVSCTCS